MQAYLKAYDLWNVLETSKDPAPLSENPTLAQMKQHSEECAKKFKALSCIHYAVSDVIFTRILACGSAKEAWDKLKEEYQGNEKTKMMQVLNLRREFEVLRMKDTESIQDDSSTDAPPPKTKSLTEIYERCNLAISELINNAEASTNEAWVAAM
ncbi:hypothetical protein GH714_020132 [Hevea brasiliensis]|uniref:DUF4219 domain-containing protein n=1 Tax=Hevea brasiliensis TaxID=3981 RepID=A0A6A6KUH4_HEVBR|nr:hypothetical protein GH714_020132 [Hevea brasiliensis]